MFKSGPVEAVEVVASVELDPAVVEAVVELSLNAGLMLMNLLQQKL